MHTWYIYKRCPILNISILKIQRTSYYMKTRAHLVDNIFLILVTCHIKTGIRKNTCYQYKPGILSHDRLFSFYTGILKNTCDQYKGRIVFCVECTHLYTHFCVMQRNRAPILGTNMGAMKMTIFTPVGHQYKCTINVTSIKNLIFTTPHNMFVKSYFGLVLHK